MSALQAVVRPDGLEAIVGADDAAWLAAEARKAKGWVERYDGADGAAGLFGEDASDGEGGVCEGGDGWPEWLGPLLRGRGNQWRRRVYLKYHSSIGAIGHGDVVWAAGEELAQRILAHEAPFEAVGMERRVVEMGAGAAACRRSRRRRAAARTSSRRTRPSPAASRARGDGAQDGGDLRRAAAACGRAWGESVGGPVRRRIDGRHHLRADRAHETARDARVFEANRQGARRRRVLPARRTTRTTRSLAFFDRARERGLAATEVDVVQRGASESMRGVIMATDPAGRCTRWRCARRRACRYAARRVSIIRGARPSRARSVFSSPILLLTLILARLAAFTTVLRGGLSPL